jgi:hypothetical protein
MKTRLFLFLLITTISISCNSDKDNNSDTPSIVGNWTLYKVETVGKPEDDEICDKNCATEVYKSNGTCIFTEDIYVQTYIYKIEGDFIKCFNPSTEQLERTEQIVSLTKDEMRKIIYQNKNEILVFRRDK